MPQDSLHFLASLYDPPLRSFSSLAGHPFQRAQAAAWGHALQEWLAGYPNPKTRRHYRQAVSSLLSFSKY